MQDETTREQLRLIALVHEVLGEAGIEHWLGGGWGVDFTLGRMTRPHEDIDFAVWSADWPEIEALLVAKGMQPKVARFPEETRRLLYELHDLEFWLLRKNGHQIEVGGRWSGWPL